VEGGVCSDDDEVRGAVAGGSKGSRGGGHIRHCSGAADKGAVKVVR
jgi:hypothetical protein